MDVGEFRRASHSIWERMAAGWDERRALFEGSARSVTDRLLEGLSPRRGQTILDLAAGTGTVGFAAAGPVGADGRVIVSDFSRAMTERAERRAAVLGLANVECRVLDAERLDLPDDAVDGVVCRWGYMLMADPGRALAETRRVLRGGGRLACAVFGAPEDNHWAAVPARVLQERGHMPAPAAGSPGILALADRERLRDLLSGRGFADVSIEPVGFEWWFGDLDDYWGFLLDAAGAIAMVLRRLDDGQRAAVRTDIGARLASFEGAGGVRLPAVSLVVTAS